MNPNPHRSESGFTFIEIMLALLILGSSAVAMIQLEQKSLFKLHQAKQIKGTYMTLLNKLYDLEPLDPTQPIFLPSDLGGTIETSWDINKTDEVLEPFNTLQPQFYYAKKAVIQLRYKAGDETFSIDAPLIYLTAEQQDAAINPPTNSNNPSGEQQQAQ